MGGGEWAFYGWVGVGGTLFGGGGGVGEGGGGVGVSGGWVQCLIMPIIFEEFQGLLLTN